MDGVNNAFCSSKEEYEIARLTTKCAGLQGKIDDQAAEIASLQETLDAVAKVASDAENLVISQRDEIGKYKALCDQMGNAMHMHGTPFLHHELRYMEALEAWRELK